MENTLTLSSQFTALSSFDSDQSTQSPINTFFKKFQRKTLKQKIFKNILNLSQRTKSTSQSIGQGKLITKKMRTKLLQWLQKLALETFEFQTKTFLLAIKILDEYLCFSNEAPSQLQLIGCSCLYLASKTSQSTVVAAQCYRVACCEIFSETQLLQKQRTIYRTLNYNTSFTCLLKVYNMIMRQSQPKYEQYNNSEMKDLNKLFIEITKNLDFLQFNDIQIVTMLVFAMQNGHRVPDSHYILTMLKEHFSEKL